MSALRESRSPARRYVLLGTGLLALRKDDFLLAGVPSLRHDMDAARAYATSSA